MKIKKKSSKGHSKIQYNRNKDTQYRVSICMIVKNEEKNLPRLFNSIKNLLAMPEVELIVVDTGSTDNTINIVKQYTNKIYHYKWNNSFADARNYSIKFAKGEYILVFDADDELVSEYELISMIKNNTIRQSNTIFFKLHNVLKTGYTELTQPRMFRNLPNFKYTGTIHNQPVMNEPITQTELLINHYGYYDKALLNTKMRERTIPLLLKEIEHNPKSYRLFVQLAQSYIILDMVRHGYELALEAIKLKTNKKVTIDDPIFVAIMYYALITFYMGDYITSSEVIKDSLKIFPNNIDLLEILANIYRITGYIDKANEIHRQVLEYVKTNEKFYYDRPYEFYTLQKVKEELNGLL